MASAVYMVGHVDTRDSTLAVLCLPYVYKVFRFYPPFVRFFTGVL
jgi:hypothetical protein